MHTQQETNCCSLEQGEIFPGSILNEEYCADKQSNKAEQAKHARSCYQEMLDNYVQARW